MTMLNRTVCSAIAASALLAGAGLAPAAGPEKPSAASRKAAPATSAAVVPPALVQEANAALGLLDSDVVALTLDRRPGRRVVTDVELEGVVRTLDLEPHSARSPVYEVRVQQPDGTWEIHAPGPVRTLRGTVDGLPGATVAATMLDEGLKAMILLPDDRRLWIEPLAGRTPLADETHHVV